MKSLIFLFLFFGSVSSYACIIEGKNKLKYCVGDKVLDYAGYQGVIGGIYDNNDIAVQYGGKGKYNRRPAYEYAVTNGCSHLSPYVCVGDEVVAFFTDGYSFNATGLFQNGYVFVKHRAGTRHLKAQPSNVAVTKGCTSDDFCVGDIVLVNGVGYKAVVTGVFTNKKVTLKFSKNGKHHSRKTYNLLLIDAVSKRTPIIK